MLKLRTVLFILPFFCISFLFDEPNYNQNIMVKGLGFKLFTIVVLVLSASRVLKKNLIIKLGKLDIIIISFFCLYLYFIIKNHHNLYTEYIPIFCILLFFSLNVFTKNYLTLGNDILNSVVTIVPFIIIGHATVVIFQFFGAISVTSQNNNYGSTFGHSDMLGTFLVTSIPFCFIKLNHHQNLRYLAIAIGIILLITIQSRSALLSLCLGSLIWYLSNYKIQKKLLIKLVIGAGMLLLSLILWYPQSVTGRIFVWYLSFKMMIANPFGWGPLAFDKDYLIFQGHYLSNNPIPFNFITPDIVHSPFNEFLHIGVTLGVIGLLLYIGLVIYLIAIYIKTRSIWFLPVIIFIINGCFYFTFNIIPVLVIVVLCISVISSSDQVMYQIKIPKYHILIIIPLLASYITIKSFTYFLNNKRWIQTMAMIQDNKLLQADSSFNSLFPKLHNDPRFLMSFATLKIKQREILRAIRLMENAKSRYIDEALLVNLGHLYEKNLEPEKALTSYQMASNIVPDRLYPQYCKLLLLKNLKRDKEAYNEAVRLANMKIKSTTYIDSYIIQGEAQQIVRDYQQSNIEITD